MKSRFGIFVYLKTALLVTACVQCSFSQTLFPTVPKNLRGNFSYELEGTHDANNIRTAFKNYGMVGGFYDADPGNVDLSVFHSAEVPKGSGMNYTDGITPFVLAKVLQGNGENAYIMETGFRERQQLRPGTLQFMRFEPRPGYMQLDPSINRDRSPAMSNIDRTWPSEWIDKLSDINDPGWKGSWNGYFGKKPAADQESYFVMDDDLYTGWDYFPDSRDNTRRGLGLRIDVRGFQWSNPQAGNVMFWHYDISNEGTTNYDDNIIFGLYMDAGVGGSGQGCDPMPESDDDNAFYDKSTGLNLVYTWDTYGHGKSKVSNCGATGYLGYAYLETPGKPSDVFDNDDDGITDENRNDTPGQKITGQQNILDYFNAHYNKTKFEAIYGPVTNRPAYKTGVWWTGDEDMDWNAEFNDTGADGVFGTNDAGEKDGIPTQGETNYGQTDLHESDQIGLTGFKMNRINPGITNLGGPTDGIVFYNDGKKYWPKILYDMWTDNTPANRFDPPLTKDYNIAFLFASGTFKLPAGSRERFSLALAYGSSLYDLRHTVTIVQQIYNANYQFATPPPTPTVKAETGDTYVKLSWDDVAERSIDPVTYINDFEGYKIYRATDPEFRDIKVISNGQGTGPMVFGRPIAQFDLQDGIQGYSNITVDGVSYFLGNDVGVSHTFKDTTVVNGQEYFYAVCAYDFGADSIGFYPSENAITVSRTLRGGVVLPKNVVDVRPEPKVLGYVSAQTGNVIHTKGNGQGVVSVEIANSNLVPDKRTLNIRFKNFSNSSFIKPDYYELADSASGKIYIDKGTDFIGAGVGQVGGGLKPIIRTNPFVLIDTGKTRFTKLSSTNIVITPRFENTTSISSDKKHYKYPNDLKIIFSNSVVDTSFDFDADRVKTPSKFAVYAVNDDNSFTKLRFAFWDKNGDGNLSQHGEYINIADTSLFLDIPGVIQLPNFTWTFQVDTTNQYTRGTLIAPKTGDTLYLGLQIPIMSSDEYSFTTRGQRIEGNNSKIDYTNEPYVVPNPYVGAAAFEPEKFAISGRGERRMEFRQIPLNAVVRIYTVKGDLVQTLRQDGSNDGFIAWNLRTKDNMDIAPGLYIFHVDGNNAGSYIGKFAIIK